MGPHAYVSEVGKMVEIMEESDKCECGQESTRGCHEIKDMENYSRYYCDTCYHRKFTVPQKKEKKRVKSTLQADNRGNAGVSGEALQPTA